MVCDCECVLVLQVSAIKPQCGSLSVSLLSWLLDYWMEPKARGCSENGSRVSCWIHSGCGWSTMQTVVTYLCVATQLVALSLLVVTHCTLHLLHTLHPLYTSWTPRINLREWPEYPSPEVPSLVPSLCTPPGEKWSSEWSWISWALNYVALPLQQWKLFISIRVSIPFWASWPQIIARLHCRKSALPQEIRLGSPDRFISWEGKVWGRD